MGEDLKQCTRPLRRVFKRLEVHACDDITQQQKGKEKKVCADGEGTCQVKKSKSQNGTVCYLLCLKRSR